MSLRGCWLANQRWILESSDANRHVCGRSGDKLCISADMNSPAKWPPLPTSSPGSSTACALWSEKCCSSISVSSARTTCDGDGCSTCNQRCDNYARLTARDGVPTGACSGEACAGPESALTNAGEPCPALVHVNWEQMCSARLGLGRARRFQQAMPRLPVPVPRLPVLRAAIVARPAAALVLLPQAAGMKHVRAESRAGVLRNVAWGHSSALWRWSAMVVGSSRTGCPLRGWVGEAASAALNACLE